MVTRQKYHDFELEIRLPRYLWLISDKLWVISLPQVDSMKKNHNKLTYKHYVIIT